MMIRLVCLLIIIAYVSAISNVVHLHGAWHGSWVYNGIKDKLRYNTHFIDYPTLINKTGNPYPSLNDYVSMTINSTNERFGSHSEFSLVAHSAAGPIASLVADRLGSRVKSIVYVSAFIIPNDTSLVEIGSIDTQSKLYQNILLNIDPLTGYPDGTYYVNGSVVADIFYNECSNKDVTYAKARFNNREVFPVTEPVLYKSTYLNHVKKYYVLNKKDNAISLKHQKYMINSSPFGKFNTLTLNADHTPFFSKSGQLAAYLNLIFLRGK